MGQIVLDFVPQKFRAKMKTHDGHPREHGHEWEVSKVTKEPAEMLAGVKVDIENYKEERCKEGYTNNIAQDNLSM